MKLPAFLRGAPQVARQEFLANLKSVRFLIMAFLSALLVVGGAFGFSSLLSSPGFGFGGLPQVVAWGHPAWAANGSHVAVVWVSDPYGAPMAGRSVEFTNRTDTGREVLGTVPTDPAGFARLAVGTRNVVSVAVQVGTFRTETGIFFGGAENFTVAPTLQGDFSRSGRSDGLALSVLDKAGDPAVADVSVNGTPAGSVDGFGYLRLTLPLGPSTVNVTAGGEVRSFPAFVADTGTSMPLTAGPDAVLFVISTLSAFLVSIFAIVVTFDAVSKERVQGTMDLLLSRPSSRSGVLLGKLLGAFGAVALPVTLVNLAGIGAIAAASGKAPTGGFAAAFLGASLLLIAFYVMIMLIFSAYAKTSGTAVMFGFLVWLLLYPLYSIVTDLVGGALFAGDPAGYFRYSQVVGLMNPSSVCGLLIALAEPASIVGRSGTAMDPIVAGAAAVVWFVVLLILALWTFQRKAAE